MPFQKQIRYNELFEDIKYFVKNGCKKKKDKQLELNGKKKRFIF